MSVSLLGLIGSNKIAFEPYEYNISMYCIPQLLVNGKCPVRYVYTFPVWGFAMPIVANTEFVDSSF